MFLIGQEPPSLTWSVLLATTVALLLTVALLSVAYFPLLEWRFGQTLGKKLLGIHVVREDGRRISLLQSVVRRIPCFLEFFWIDAFVALFTERHQRAFDLVARTVVTRMGVGAAAPRTAVAQGACARQARLHRRRDQVGYHPLDPLASVCRGGHQPHPAAA